jgi:DNA-3-methyladenine glycosylase
LPREFFARPPDLVARDLLGCFLISELGGELTGGRIVEAEAYFGADDPASHAARLRVGRVTSMFGPPGVAYVYRSYGIHAMLNAVAHEPAAAGAVLIRALEPLWGVDAMRVRRGGVSDRLLCSGPGRLCQALAIGLDDHGLDLTTGLRLWMSPGERPESIRVGGRIGVGRAADAPLRFFQADNPFVSAHRRGTPLPTP